VDAGDAGIVDEDVDLAERLQRIVAGLLDGGAVGHVDLKCGHRVADGLRGLVGKRLVVIPDRDFGAGSHKTLGDGLANTLGAAGDDGGASVEIDLVHTRSPLAKLFRRRWSAPSPRSCGER